MDKAAINKLNAYLEDQAVLCAQRERTLAADDRADEAAFEKIRANIYGVFKSVLSAAVASGKGDAYARSFFAQRLASIPANWATAYDNAKRNGDYARMSIESIKLDAAAEIKRNFESIWSAEQ